MSEPEQSLIKELKEDAEVVKDRITEIHERLRIKNPVLRVIVGVGLIIVGLAALVTPLTPGAWLALVGLEVLGLHMTFTKRVIAWLHKRGWIR